MGKLKDLPRSLPGGLLGMLLILALTESWIGRQAFLKQENAEPWVVKGPIASRPRPRPAGGVFCFGDSLMMYGVYPRVVEEQTGRPGYNFALPAGSPETSYYLFKRLIDAGARPHAVLVDYMPYQVKITPRLEALRIRFWSECASLGELIDFCRGRPDRDYAAKLVLATCLPSYRLRGECRDAVSAALAGESRAGLDYCVALARGNMEINLGALALPEGLQTKVDPPPAVYEDYVGIPDPRKLDYIDRFIKLAAEHQVRVYWVVPPISPEYQNVSEFMGVDANYSRLLQTKVRQFANLTVVDFRPAGYPATFFHDMHHLNRKAGVILSRELGRVVASPPEGPSAHWVNVATPLDPAEPPQVETMWETSGRLGLVNPESRRR